MPLQAEGRQCVFAGELRHRLGVNEAAQAASLSRQLRWLPPRRWLRVEPRLLPAASGSLASPHPRGAAKLRAPLPRLVVELASPSDEGPRGLTALRRKMAAYQANGARLGWLLIPRVQAVEVWPASGAHLYGSMPQTFSMLDEIPGLRLELDEIWAG